MRRFIFFVALAVCATIVAAQSIVPTLMNYQGRLTKPDGTPVQDGNYKIVFKLFDTPTGASNLVWSETQNSVVLKNGVFAVMLGGSSPLSPQAMAGPRFLEIQLNNDPPLTPRQQIVTVAYAMVARSAEDAAHAGKADQATNADHATTADVAATSTTAGTVADGAITTAKLVDGAVTYPKITPLDKAVLSDPYVFSGGASSTALSSGLGAVIGWNSEDIDSNGLFSSGAKDRLTIQTTGIYQISAKIALTGHTDSNLRRLLVDKNGSAILGIVESPALNAAYDSHVEITFIASLKAGDYLRVLALQSSGVDLFLDTTPGYDQFSAVLIP